MRILWPLSVVALLCPLPVAAAPILTYMHHHHIVTIDAGAHPEWRHTVRQWLYRGVVAEPPERLRSCGRNGASLVEENWSVRESRAWNIEAIMRTIRGAIASVLDRPAGTVTIRRSETGSIVFDGRGLPGRTVQIETAARLTITALETGQTIIELPIVETAPTVTVDDEKLRADGIREVVTVGESVFKGSPVNRRHNIAVGIARFNGHLIPQGSVFSFVKVLGAVNASTGYRKELVIQGAETLPDYGGGLCQVSSTAYRGPWEYGLPILQRKNHSYAVSYYSPQGTDATIYPPAIDLKFLNDTPGSLLIQSFSDDKDRAYFVYYGTRDHRRAQVIGPFISNRTPAPTDERISYTTELPPGERRKAGEKHDGLRATWYRLFTPAGGTGSIIERYTSIYEARPLTWQVGIPASMAAHTDGATSGEPSWLPSSR